jgi:hypothetical protein
MNLPSWKISTANYLSKKMRKKLLRKLSKSIADDLDIYDFKKDKLNRFQYLCIA